MGFELPATALAASAFSVAVVPATTAAAAAAATFEAAAETATAEAAAITAATAAAVAVSTAATAAAKAALAATATTAEAATGASSAEAAATAAGERARLRLEAVTAVDRAIATGFERHFGFFAARSAGRVVELSRRPAVTTAKTATRVTILLLLQPAAVRTAPGFPRESL